jgi:cytochrome b561
MGDLEISPLKIKVFAWHKWAGMTVLFLSVLRIVWRTSHPAPGYPENMALWQVRASKLVQWSLYLLLFAVPLTGWLFSSAAGYSVFYFNLIHLPDLVEKNKELADQLHEIHESLNWALLGLFVVHVAAALKHHFIDKDHVLIRMIKSTPKTPLMGLVGCLLLIGGFEAEPAHAAGFIPEKSEIKFISRQMGVEVEGRFRKFEGEVVFKPTDLAKSAARIDVDLASIDLGSADSEQEVKGKDWFLVSSFPKGSFQTTSIKLKSPDHYEATGKFTLKGISKELSIPITTKQVNGHTIAEGQFNLKRTDFKIGQGVWADPEAVGIEITVIFRLALN